MKVYLYQHPLKVFIEIFYLLDRRSLLIPVLVLCLIVCLFIPEHRSSDFIAEHHHRGCQIQGAVFGARRDLYVKMAKL